MSSATEPVFTPGTALVLTTIENGFPAKRAVEFLSMSNGGQQATVKFGLETFNVQLDQLSRAEPPGPPAFLRKWFEVPKPPQPPSEADIDAKLAERRQQLAQAHTRAKLAQDQQTASRSISQRADRGVAEAKATLATLDAHQRAEQVAFEEAIQLGRPIPQRANGHDDRGYLVQRLAAAEAAQQRFDRETTEATTALSNSLSAVRRAAANVVAALLERETENLRAAEQRAALLRAELTSVAGWWPSAEIGVLKIDRASAACIEAPVAWRDQPAVRQSSGLIKEWQGLFDRLVQGDVAADFDLQKD